MEEPRSCLVHLAFGVRYDTNAARSLWETDSGDNEKEMTMQQDVALD